MDKGYLFWRVLITCIKLVLLLAHLLDFALMLNLKKTENK